MDIIRTLELEPHPEGGWYRETFRAESVAGKRGTLTAIYYLLRENERSHWHRVWMPMRSGIGMSERPWCSRSGRKIGQPKKSL